MRVEIRELPSGFWSVWVDNDWITASAASEHSARIFVEESLGKEALKSIVVKRKTKEN